MSEDMQYQSGHNAEASHTKKRKLEVLPEDTIRGKPKAKADTKANASGSETAYPKQILPEQGEKLDEWLNIMRTSGHKLADLEADISELGDDWVPPVTKDRLASLQVSHHTNKEICNTLKDTGECNDFPGFIESMHSAKKEFNEQILQVERQVKLHKQI